MTSLGHRLRTQRERLGLTVSQIATQTKIRETYLEAIENDRLESIPGGFFSRAFVRQYAIALGLKAEEIEGQLEAVTVPPEETVRVEKIMNAYQQNASGHRNHRGALLPGEEEEPEYFHQAEFLKDSNTGKRWLALAAVLIVGCGAYLTWQRSPEMLTKLWPATSKTDIVWPTLPTPPRPSVVVPETIGPEPIPAAVESAKPVPQSQPPANDAASNVQVAVVAKEKSWVRLISDGTKLFGGTMEAGERRVLNGSASAVIFTGNAGGIELAYNGRPLGAVGPRGQVRTAVFTPQGYEIRKNEPLRSDGGRPPAASSQP